MSADLDLALLVLALALLAAALVAAAVALWWTSCSRRGHDDVVWMTTAGRIMARCCRRCHRTSWSVNP